MNRLPEDLSLLLALDVLLAERHVTRAAKRLAITQSAASQRLRKLRTFFGDPLLVDARPLMALTPRAAALAGPLRKALSALADSVAVAAPFDPRTSRRRFVLLGNDAVEMLAIPPLLASLREGAPQVSIEMSPPGPMLADRLGTGGADLAIVPSMHAQPSLRQRKLFDDPFVVMMRAGHAATKSRLTLARYVAASHLLIAPQGAPGSFVDEALAAKGATRHVVATVRHFAPVPFIVAAGDVIVTCPLSLALAAEALLPLVHVEPPVELPAMTICTVWHDRVHHDAAHVWLRDMIERAFAASLVAARVRRPTKRR